MGLQIYDEKELIEAIVTFAAADGTTGKTVHSATYNRERIDHILVTSTSASAHDFTLGINSDGTGPLVTVSIPAGAGSLAGVPPIDLVSFLPTGMDCFFMVMSDYLGGVLAVTLTAAEKIQVVALGGSL